MNQFLSKRIPGAVVQYYGRFSFYKGRFRFNLRYHRRRGTVEPGRSESAYWSYQAKRTVEAELARIYAQRDKLRAEACKRSILTYDPNKNRGC